MAKKRGIGRIGISINGKCTQRGIFVKAEKKSAKIIDAFRNQELSKLDIGILYIRLRLNMNAIDLHPLESDEAMLHL